MTLPLFGVGTYKVKGELCQEIIINAIEKGYNLIDTARCYRNESQIGSIISTINRDKIFITSKIPPNEQGEENAYLAVCDSLTKLNISCIDLMLIHWPGGSKRPPSSSENKSLRHSSWRGLIRARDEGLVKYIGVSNFTISHLKELIEVDGLEIPFVNQAEIHPFCQQIELRQYCSTHGIKIQAYSSLGQGSLELIQHPIIVSMSTKYNLSVSALLLIWAMQQQIAVIPKASSQKHLLDNYNAFVQYQEGIRLTEEDITVMSGLDKDHHFCWNPNTVT